LKTKLLLLATSFLAVLSPVKPMIYVALLAIILDTCFGIWRSVKKGGWKAIRSRRLSHVLSKSLLYCGSILFVFIIEKYIAADLLAHFIAVDLVTGKNLLKSLRSFVTRAKEEADKLT